MRFLVSGGGTGGHVYPILTVVAALQSRLQATPAAPRASGSLQHSDAHKIRFAGTREGVEAALVARTDLDFVPISAGQMHIRNPLRLAVNSGKMARGGVQALRLMKQWRPDALFVTGGFVCAPVVWAADRLRIPILIYLPDVTPGLAVQRLARYALRVAVTFPEVAAYFPDKAIVTGYPVRQELRRRSLSKDEARLTFKLQPHRPTVLIFGGSRGSRSINQATAAILPDLLDSAQVLHITGDLDWESSKARAQGLTPDQRAGYRGFPYLHDDMVAALCAADLVVARAGASTLGEFPALGLPAVLVPLPISGQHQLPNARYLSDRGAAQIVADADMSHELLPTLQALLAQPERLAAMSGASAALAQPEAADRLADILLQLSRAQRPN